MGYCRRVWDFMQFGVLNTFGDSYDVDVDVTILSLKMFEIDVLWEIAIVEV